MRRGGRAALFTSDLSVNEFLLVKEAGFDPLGLVEGSSMNHIGYQQSMWNQNQEMTVLSEALYKARELAMARMEEEAAELGADGIVGVRLTARHFTWQSNLAEFVATGTAVSPRDGLDYRTPKVRSDEHEGGRHRGGQYRRGGATRGALM